MRTALSGLLVALALPAAHAQYAGARGACQLFVERQLAEPAAAEWGDPGRWTVLSNPDGTLSVGVKFLEATAGGGRRAAYFTCIIRRDGPGWKLEQLSRMR